MPLKRDNKDLLTLDTLLQMIEEDDMKNGRTKGIWLEDKVGQSSVTFYPKQKHKQESK